MSDLRDAIFGQIGEGRVFLQSIAKRRRAWLAVAVLTAVTFLAATACDQGFTVESSADGGESGSTPAVAFKTPRTKAPPEDEPTQTPEAEESPTPEVAESPPAEEATPTSAPTTEAAPTETPTTETAETETPAPDPATPTPTSPPEATVERTLVPAEETPTAAEGEANPETISPEVQEWVFGLLDDLTAGRTAVRPFEFDPGLIIQSESNSLVGLVPVQFLQVAFDSKVRSSYIMQAVLQSNPINPTQPRRPVAVSEWILVHETAADAASFADIYRDVAITTLGGISQQFIQVTFPEAELSFQEDTGFGVVEEEFILVGEFDLGIEGPPIRPQVYIMIGRQGNVNFGLMVLYRDSQSRMRPFALFDRLVSRIG